MSHPSDRSAQITFMGKDDIQFQKAQKRKRAPKDPTPNVPDGHCCLRCANWRPDVDPNDFGACVALVFVETKVPMGPERGTVFSLEQAMQQDEWAFDYLPTKPYMVGCSLFHERKAA